MNNKPLILAMASIAMLGTTACAQRTSNLPPPGKYESETTTIDRYGTKTEVQKSTEVELDKYGNRVGTVETKKSTDPEGLFNKSTSTSKEVVR